MHQRTRRVTPRSSKKKKFLLVRQLESEEADLLLKIFAVEQLLHLNPALVAGLVARGWLIEYDGHITCLSTATRELLAVKS